MNMNTLSFSILLIIVSINSLKFQKIMKNTQHNFLQPKVTSSNIQKPKYI